MIDIRRFPSTDEATAAAAWFIMARLQTKPDLVLGVATGATMVPLYAHLVAAHRAGVADFSQVRCFSVDEYVGLPASNPASFRATMAARFYDPIGIDPARCFVPDAMARDLLAEAARYEAAIVATGGIDLMMLGIGINGHIGFNEPPADFASRTGPVDLTVETLNANKRHFDDDIVQPTRAITMGIATIMDAREILLVAIGAGKRQAIARALSGPVARACPASILQSHPHVVAILDEAAASGL
jgi:glucosamine-6-phosphate deaminase